MSEALRATGRPIVFSVKMSQPIETARSVCNLRRVTHDIKDTYYDMMRQVNVNHNDGLAKYAGPGYWNDMDMVEIGNGNMTLTEEYSHMAFWCLLKSPLILGNDLANMSKQTLEILANENAIAINQDPLGVQGTLLSAANSSSVVAIAILSNCSSGPDHQQVWRREGEATMLLRNMAVGTCLTGQGPAQPDFPAPLQPIVMNCNSSNPLQHWQFDAKTSHLINVASGLCLNVQKATMPGYQLRLVSCKAKSTTQLFTFTSKGYIQSLFPDYSDHPLCMAVDIVDDLQVWAAPLSAAAPLHRWAVILSNRAIYAHHNITLNFSALGISSASEVHVQDVWTSQDMGVFTTSLTQSVAPHGVSFVVLTTKSQ